MRTITLPPGVYDIACWGAMGENGSPGRYSETRSILFEDTTWAVAVGRPGGAVLIRDVFAGKLIAVEPE